MLKYVLTGLNNVVYDSDKLRLYKNLRALIILWSKNMSIVPNLWPRWYDFSEYRSEWYIHKVYFYDVSCLFKTKGKNEAKCLWQIALYSLWIYYYDMTISEEQV